MLLNLYLSKTYDKLKWQFLAGILKAFEFSDQWIGWVMNLVSSAFFSILVDGNPSTPFQISWGIRQGDSLSSVLFIIAVEGLGRNLKSLRLENKIKGLSIIEELEPQTHEQFVDDTMCMAPSTVQEARGIKDGLDTFLEASKLEINKVKSQVYFFNNPKIMKRNILRILGFSEGGLPSKYLGAPLAK